MKKNKKWKESKKWKPVEAQPVKRKKYLLQPGWAMCTRPCVLCGNFAGFSYITLVATVCRPTAQGWSERMWVYPISCVHCGFRKVVGPGFCFVHLFFFFTSVFFGFYVFQGNLFTCFSYMILLLFLLYMAFFYHFSVFTFIIKVWFFVLPASNKVVFAYMQHYYKQ